MRHLLPLLSLLCCVSAYASDLCVDLATTAQSNACWTKEAAQSQAHLDDYLQAARTRALTDFGLSADAFDAAQATWRTYSERQCGNVRVLWGTASVALAKAASCRVDLNDQRSYDLWKSYLTYADRTPSVMPEPALRSGK